MSTEITLSDQQLEQLADLLAARLTARPSNTSSVTPDHTTANLPPNASCVTSGHTSAVRGLVEPEELARTLGVSRSTIYEHADELGAVEVGGGSRPRLRFDPAT